MSEMGHFRPRHPLCRPPQFRFRPKADIGS